MKTFNCRLSLLVGLLWAGTLTAYDFEYDAGDIEGEKDSTGITYTLSVSKGDLGTSYDFDTKEGVTSGSPTGIDINVSSGGATGTKAYPNDSLPTANFTISMNGKLIPPSGGSGTQPTWGASGNAKAPFYIKSNQDNGAKDITVAAGTSVTYTAYEGTNSKASNWTVNGQTKNNESSIIFSRNWWDVPGWFSASMGTPVPGVYNISASPTDNASKSDSGEMKVVGVASISGHGKTSTREETPSGSDKWTDSETIYAQPKSVVELTMTLNPNVVLDDTLKNSISWSVSGWGTSITPKESNQLEAIFKPVSSGDYVVTASCGSSQRLIKVKVSAPKIHSVTFNGNITVNKDTGGSYSGVAWKDDDLDGNSDLTNANADSSKKYHPIAYRSTSTMSATAVFKPNCLKSSPADDKDFITAYDVEAAVKKVRFTPYSFWSSNNWSSPTSFIMGGTTVTAASAFNSSAQVGYHSNFELAWEVGFGESGTSDENLLWERSYSVHELYLTFNAATPSYETVFHISCTNADGKTSESQVVSSIWSKFASKNVRRKGDSAQFKYWNPASSTPQRLSLMLQDANANGSCIAWSQFFKEALNAQFSSGAQVYEVTPISGTGFLVKNWKFGSHISPGTDGILNSTATSDDVVDSGFIFPGPNGVLDSSTSGDDIIVDGFFNGNTYPYLVGYDAIDQEGVPGQGNANPPGIFGNHFIVRYSGVYYDPSYGSGGFSSSKAHEDASIDGISSIVSSWQVAKKKGSSVELSYTPTSL